MTIEQHDSQPWYKEPMMWLIVGIPLITVAWGGVMLSLAVSTKDSLVSDSYYKDGVSYTENVEIDAKAARMQLKSRFMINGEDVSLDLSGYIDSMPDTLMLQLIHPTLQDQDASALLQHQGDGHYTGLINIELPSKRRIWLQSPEQQWRIRLATTIQERQLVSLEAQ